MTLLIYLFLFFYAAINRYSRPVFSSLLRTRLLGTLSHSSLKHVPIDHPFLALVDDLTQVVLFLLLPNTSLVSSDVGVHMAKLSQSCLRHHSLVKTYGISIHPKMTPSQLAFSIIQHKNLNGWPLPDTMSNTAHCFACPKFPKAAGTNEVGFSLSNSNLDEEGWKIWIRTNWLVSNDLIVILFFVFAHLSQ